MRRELRPLLSPAMIRKGRELAGLDQAQLARLVGISRGALEEIEGGLPEEVDPPRRAILKRIRAVLETEFRLVFDPVMATVQQRRAGQLRSLLSPDMIRKGRELAGIDQGRLALLAGVTRRSIVAIEKELPEKIDPRRRALLERIRATFELEYDLIFDLSRGRVRRSIRKPKAND